MSLARAKTRLRKLDRSFFERPAIELARELVGTILVRRIAGREYRGRIVETEAYIGPHDLACHAAKGRTARTEVMFGPAGHAYVYLIYGIHQMLNIVASHTDDAQAVLVRAAEPLDGWTANLTGPGNLARGFRINRRDNKLDLTGDDLYLLSDPLHRTRVIKTRRIGVDYAKHWKNRLLRFIDVNSNAVSWPRLHKKSRAKLLGLNGK